MNSRKQKAPGKARLRILAVVLLLVWTVIIVRLAEIQLVHGADYRLKAEKQSTGKIKVKPDRGLIYDRKGRQVAVNIIRNSLYAYPANNHEIRNLRKYLKKIYRNYNNSKSTGSGKIKANRFRWLDRQLSDEMARQIMKDSIPGLYIREELGREYPFGRVGRQLVGITDIDGQGIAGLEYSYDSIMAGRSGLIDYLRDAKAKTYRINEIPLVKPVAGNSMVLTIDWQFQEIVEEELQKAVNEFNALEGIALFMDCHTGEILAAADYQATRKNKTLKLKAVSDVVEPGSVFKIFTTAALLEEDLVDTSEVIYCENGLWRCGRRLLRDDKKLDSLSLRDIFRLSSNIGIGKLALRLGGEKLIEYARKFGFENKTLIGLPGEQAGAIGRPGVWSDYNVAALAMGHAISVTPLQLVTAVASVANRGQLLQPTIMRGIIDSQGNILKKNKLKTIARVLNNDNAAILQSYMTDVVLEGTATPVKSDLISIAGKTGTAEAVDFENGGYIKNKFVASFLGYFPADNPKIAGVVILHQPEPVHYGGHTAGPAFRNMAERFTIANVNLIRSDTRIISENDDMELKSVPDFTGQELRLARSRAEKKGFSINCNNDSGMVIWQYPPKDRKIPEGGIVTVIIQDSLSGKIKMFDFKSMNMRTAAAVLNRQGLNFEFEGSGKIKRQYPRAGKSVKKNEVCRLVGHKG